MDIVSVYLKLAEQCRKSPTIRNEKRLKELELKIVESEFFYKMFKL